MSTNAENVRKDLRYYKRLERATKDSVVQNATPINPKKYFLHFVQEAPKGLHQVALFILHQDTAEVIVNGVVNSWIYEYSDFWHP